MNSQEKTRAERIREIEHKHLGVCLEQIWPTGWRCVIEWRELIDYRSRVIVIKWFEGSVPKRSTAKWPEISAVDVYLPIKDDNTFDGLDASLEAYRASMPR